ncbi:MAG: hypothetical protein A2X93_08970 [Deltaproteobacteria bacterium GWC2_56_8]|nr:MAG: hypothetical protein A2X99_02050 [Deltaproteobacteria bacterium GWB2_55_19]OGP38861.1 MAG: hypothetical protein A2X93_08970 [Deltaproteobacteria bacterium GWC2_56_8]HAO94064.1 hypothetical protein [Deltaproteobacteria bacterium]
MKRAILGSNTFEDCGNIIIVFGTPLFSYTIDGQVKLSFKVLSPPANTPIHIENNDKIAGNVTVKADDKSASISLNLPESKAANKLIDLSIDNGTAHINLDLRPLGLNIYSDKNAFHVGGSQLSGNVFKNCANGIAIGD